MCESGMDKISRKNVYSKNVSGERKMEASCYITIEDKEVEQINIFNKMIMRYIFRILTLSLFFLFVYVNSIYAEEVNGKVALYRNAVTYLALELENGSHINLFNVWECDNSERNRLICDYGKSGKSVTLSGELLPAENYYIFKDGEFTIKHEKRVLDCTLLKSGRTHPNLIAIVLSEMEMPNDIKIERIILNDDYVITSMNREDYANYKEYSDLNIDAAANNKPRYLCFPHVINIYDVYGLNNKITLYTSAGVCIIRGHNF